MPTTEKHRQFMHRLMSPSVEGWHQWFAWRPVYSHSDKRWYFWEWIEKGTLWGPIGDSGYGVGVYRKVEARADNVIDIGRQNCDPH